MKKVSIVFTLMLVATMLLAACGGGTTPNQEGGTGLETPMETLDTGGTGVGLETETPADTTGGSTTMTETPMVDTTPTEEMEASPTVEATTEATTEATEEATGTPESTTGGTTGGTGAAMTPSYSSLSDFSAMTVQDSSGAEVGTVNGVVVMLKSDSGTGTSSSDSGGATSGSSTDATATPEGGSTSGGTTDATATPESSTGSGSSTDATATPESSTASGSTTTDDTTSMASQMDGQVAYVVVSPSASFGETNMDATTGNSLLIPWTAFESTGETVSDSGSTTGGSATDATATPEGGSTSGGATDATATPEGGSTTGGATDATATPESSTGSDAGGSTTGTMDDNVLTLTLSADELASAPVVSDAELAQMSGGMLNDQVASFWSGQGMPIPATGAEGTGTTGANYVPVTLQSEMSNFAVVDAEGNALGTVADYIFDRANGRVQYAVVDATGNTIPVPMKHFSFQSGSTGTDGQFVINVSQNEFTGAPAVDWSMMDFEADPMWNTDLDRYWFGLE